MLMMSCRDLSVPLKAAVFLATIVMLASAFVQAEEGEGVHGLVTTSSCPLTCAELRVAPENCREKRIGDSCSVEDLSQAPGHRSLARLPADASTKKASRRNGGGMRTWRDGQGTWVAIPRTRAETR